MENSPVAHANYMMYKGGVWTKPLLLWHHAGNQDNEYPAKADDQTLHNMRASIRQQLDQTKKSSKLQKQHTQQNKSATATSSTTRRWGCSDRSKMSWYLVAAGILLTKDWTLNVKKKKKKSALFNSESVSAYCFWQLVRFSSPWCRKHEVHILLKLCWNFGSPLPLAASTTLTLPWYLNIYICHYIWFPLPSRLPCRRIISERTMRHFCYRDVNITLLPRPT